MSIFVNDIPYRKGGSFITQPIRINLRDISPDDLAVALTMIATAAVVSEISAAIRARPDRLFSIHDACWACALENVNVMVCPSRGYTPSRLPAALVDLSIPSGLLYCATACERIAHKQEIATLTIRDIRTPAELERVCDLIYSMYGLENISIETLRKMDITPFIRALPTGIRRVHITMANVNLHEVRAAFVCSGRHLSKMTKVGVRDPMGGYRYINLGYQKVAGVDNTEDVGLLMGQPIEGYYDEPVYPAQVRSYI